MGRLQIGIRWCASWFRHVINSDCELETGVEKSLSLMLSAESSAANLTVRETEQCD